MELKKPIQHTAGMQYFGGKKNIAKPIVELLSSLRQGRDYLEPFCGGLWITTGITEGIRKASDISQPLITMYRALQHGWQPPDTLSEAQYTQLKLTRDPTDPLTAFAGHGCSFSGKYFGGYARGQPGRNYAKSAKAGLLKKMNTCMDVEFTCCDYLSWDPCHSLIYCDPPYCGTTMYSGTGEWDSNKFWDVMGEWSQPSRHNTVIISEYTAPDTFESLLQIPVQTGVRTKEKEYRTEKVFRLKK